MNIRPYYNEDKSEVAVLISGGSGAGWSSWHSPELAYDYRVVKFFLEGHSREEMKDFLQTIGYEQVYMGGFKGLTARWVPTGTMFRITEYDGAEGIEIFNKEDWMCF